MRLLHRLQGLVERTYDVANPHRVTDYLVTCPQIAASLGLGQAAVDSGEQVLVSEDQDGIDLAVFLDREVLDELRAENPMRALHDGNLDHFWTALEGVSHFVFLAWSAAFERQTTRLELELQAEIDKFVLSAMLIASQFGGRVPADLHTWLFERSGYAEHLDADLLAVYGRANRGAAR